MDTLQKADGACIQTEGPPITRFVLKLANEPCNGWTPLPGGALERAAVLGDQNACNRTWERRLGIGSSLSGEQSDGEPHQQHYDDDAENRISFLGTRAPSRNRRTIGLILK